MTLDAGAYSVRHGPARLRDHLPAECAAAHRPGETLTCTIIADDQPGFLGWSTRSSTTTAAAPWRAISRHRDRRRPSPASFPGAGGAGTVVTLDAGPYAVSRPAPGYDSVLGADCAGTISPGGGADLHDHPRRPAWHADRGQPGRQRPWRQRGARGVHRDGDRGRPVAGQLPRCRRARDDGDARCRQLCRRGERAGGLHDDRGARLLRRHGAGPDAHLHDHERRRPAGNADVQRQGRHDRRRPRPERHPGDPGDDVIVDLDGSNIVRGRGGRDTVCTGAGDDRSWAATARTPSSTPAAGTSSRAPAATT